MFRGAGFQAGYARFHAGIFCSTGILACVSAGYQPAQGSARIFRHYRLSAIIQLVVCLRTGRGPRPQTQLLDSSEL
jgi:hypothetical protein